jgi:hypothetical protein
MSSFVNTANLAFINPNLYMSPHMKPVVIVTSCMLLLAGCAHLEVLSQNIYPFCAEFDGAGMIDGSDVRIAGALLLNSPGSGIVQVYGPGGMASYTIDINGTSLILKDMWGKKTDTISLPMSDMVGLLAGDVPRGAYLYKEKTTEGMKVIYPWGVLGIDAGTLPIEVHVKSDPPLDLIFNPKGKIVMLEVSHGLDILRLTLIVKQGGRWLSL